MLDLQVPNFLKTTQILRFVDSKLRNFRYQVTENVLFLENSQRNAISYVKIDPKHYHQQAHFI